MNNDMRKRLTEYLGECWHTHKGVTMSRNHGPSLQKCSKCSDEVTPYDFGDPNRTFTDARDMDALRRRLVEKGEWQNFFHYTQSDYRRGLNLTWHQFNESEFTNLLMQADKFCSLVGEWLEGKEEL
jgi:hypothetical protein